MANVRGNQGLSFAAKTLAKLYALVGGSPRSVNRDRGRGRCSARIDRIESLEGRFTPSATGLSWYAPDHLTLSFAPDGATIGSQSNQLFQRLDGLRSRGDWQTEILRAFQSWAVHSNLNIAVTSDGGQPFGTAGMTQNDARFGDIRIGSVQMSSNVVGMTVAPEDFLGGTWVGDVLLNTVKFQPSNPSSLIGTVLHEAGHVFGLEHSDSPSSVMFPTLNPTTTAPSASDIENLQALHGRRAADAYEGDSGNETLANSTSLSSIFAGLNQTGSVPWAFFADVTTPTDVDVYRLTVPSTINQPYTFRVQSAGVSLLAPKLTVTNSRGETLATLTSTMTMGDVLSVQLPRLEGDTTYYFRVEAARSDVFGVGRYGFSVVANSSSTVSPSTLNRVLTGPHGGLSPLDLQRLFAQPNGTRFNPDNGLNDSIGNATVLTTTPGFAARTRFGAVGSIEDTGDVDYYRVRTPSANSGFSGVMTAVTRAFDNSYEAPRARVFDEAGTRIDVNIVANGSGQYVVQADGLAPSSVYYIEVRANTRGPAVGNYQFAVDLRAGRVDLERVGLVNLSQQQSEVTKTLYVGRSTLFHMVLNVSSQAGAASYVGGSVIILDSQGRYVHTLSARVGETRSMDSFLLKPGYYSVRYVAVTRSGETIPDVRLRLRVSELSDPIGPIVDDPAGDPVPPGPGGPGGDPTVWLDPDLLALLTPTELQELLNQLWGNGNNP